MMNSTEVILSATVSTGMGVGSKKVKIARGVNTMTEGGEISLITPPAKLAQRKERSQKSKLVQ